MVNSIKTCYSQWLYYSNKAVLLGKIVISYQPFKYPRVDSYLPNAISISLKNVEEILLYLNDINENKLNIEKIIRYS